MRRTIAVLTPEGQNEPRRTLIELTNLLSSTNASSAVLHSIGRALETSRSVFVKGSRRDFALWSPSAPVWTKWPSTIWRPRPSSSPGKPSKSPNDFDFPPGWPYLVGFFMIVTFVPWTQTITVTGQLSAYTPPLSARKTSGADYRSYQKVAHLRRCGVKAGDVILELDDYDPNFMAPRSL